MKFLIYFLLFIVFPAFGQEVTPAINWSMAGLVEKSNVNLVEIDFQQEMKRSSLSADELMAELIKDNPSGAIILFKEGAYLFRKQIKLQSNFILRGEGAAKTKLIFDLSAQNSPILVSGTSSRELIQLSDAVAKGETELHFKTADLTKYPLVDVGEFVLLADKDEELITSSWAKGKTGQLLEVIRVGIEGVEVNDNARRNYNMINRPILVKVEMIKNVGIEKLSIENKTKTSQQTSNIHFRYAHNCWVSSVSSRKANYSHVLLEYASHCQVRNCSMNDAHDFGNGGKAYGITLQFATSSCLIEGNRLQRLRHAILLQAGANGNVIRANKSYDPYWEGVMLPKNASGDIVLHGNYVYANLIERNNCQNLVIDNSHGYNGPDNVIFWNIIEGY